MREEYLSEEQYNETFSPLNLYVQRQRKQITPFPGSTYNKPTAPNSGDIDHIKPAYAAGAVS